MSSEAASSLYNIYFLNDSFLSTWYSLWSWTLNFLRYLCPSLVLPGSIVVITRMWQEVDTCLLNECPPPQHESSSFPFFASLPVNVVRGILTAITAASLGMSHIEGAHPCKAQLMTGFEYSWS